MSNPAEALPVLEAVSPFYIPSMATARTMRPRTLKRGDTFIVLDAYGDAQASGPSAEGLYHQDTRFLSNLVLLVNGERPLLLRSATTSDNEMLSVDLTNSDVYEGDQLKLARDTVHLLRVKVLADGACFEALEIRSFADHEVALDLRYAFAADFADIFEVRGQHRARRGRLLREEMNENGVTLGYRGLDNVVRRAEITFAPRPQQLSRREARFRIELAPGDAARVTFTVRCGIDGAMPHRDLDFARAVQAAEALTKSRRASAVLIRGSNSGFNTLMERSRADLDMLVTDTPAGPYPYAGIPWFSTPFGRDALITALQSLWLAPHLAKGVLGFLAANQATELAPEMDAEPGKILHEMRKGEMASLGEVPFGRYYGSIDSTPLFVLLAAEYFGRTGDREFMRAIWPNLTAALDWMQRYGDIDNDGFIEYDRRSDKGLSNQGWKDSNDSIFHADGRLAEPPIALVEVQAYAYAAWRGAAMIAAALDETETERECAERAASLQRKFEEAFWCAELGTYALALDGRKQPCRVRSSNAGHALYAGIATRAHAARCAATLMEPRSFSDWGIRTIAEGEARYNPMSYHDGSIWPHDNGIIAMGFARYGLREPLLRVMSGLFDAAAATELYRLPELFCGFPRRRGEGPTSYPVACSPQAWSSASAFAMLGAALGVSFLPQARQIRFNRPVLPSFLEELRLERLTLCDISVDLLFRRYARDVSLNVLRKEGEAEIVLISG